MGKNGFKVMDSDMHILEPIDLWDRYIEPAYRGRIRARNKYERDLVITVDGKITNSNTGSYTKGSSPAILEAVGHEREGQNAKYQDAEDHGWDSNSQIRAMDNEGIDVAVLYPSRALFSMALDTMDPGLAAAAGRAYNDWMFDFCQEHPGRLYGAGHISPYDVDSAVSETRRCVEELGFKAVFLRPDIINNRQWDDPYYNSLWAECQRLNLPVGFHAGGRPPGLTQVGDREFGSSPLALHHVYSHSMTMMLALGSFCGAGILQRFPELRVAFLEGNCAWVPWLLWRLDEHYEWRSFDFPELTMFPSEYFKRQGFASVECDEWPAKYVEDAGYGDNVVFSTDFPHPDSKYPHAVDSFMGLEIDEDSKRKYLWDNCARLYDL